MENCHHNFMIPGSKGLNPHELAHRWVNDQDIISLITMNCEAQE